MAAVLDPDEVMLYGTRFRIVGPVQSSLLDPFPPKVVFGDYQRINDITSSSWDLSDFSGGLGVEHWKTPDDDNRYAYGNLDSRWPYQLTLAPKVTLQDTTIVSVDLFIDYNTKLYAFAGTSVYQWNEGSMVWNTMAHTMDAHAIDAVVHADTLYVTQDNSQNIATFDGTTWGTTTLNADYLAVWNGNLYALQRNGTLQSWDGTAWSSMAAIDLPAGYVTQLVSFFDVDSNSTLFAVTKEGLYGFDALGSKWVQSLFTFPYHPDTGIGTMFQGSFYLPVGTAAYRYDPNAQQPVGPDKDEGLPPDFRGNITQIVASHGSLYAGINGILEGGVTTPLNIINIGEYSNDTFFSLAASRGAIIASNGSSWHILYQFENTGDNLGAMYVSRADNKYRLWFSSTSGVYRMDLPLGLPNPMKNTTKRFQKNGSLVTSWFNAEWFELTKVGIAVETISHNITATEYIQIFAQYDENPEWSFIGKVTSDGRQEFGVKLSEGGKAFKKIRFRVDFTRDPADDSKSPVLESVALSFVRRPKPLWSYQFTIDLSKMHKKQTVKYLRTRIKEILESETAGYFYYTPEDDADISALVLPGRVEHVVIPGTDQRGRMTISVLQLKAGD